MIRIDISKAKEITHAKRRAARAVEFAPVDIEATIPALTKQAEAKRAEIRDKYAEIQAQIDRANSVDSLKNITTQL